LNQNFKMKSVIIIAFLIILINNQVINWGPCPTSENPNNNNNLECSFVKVKENWETSTNFNLTYFIRRIKADPNKKKGSLWLIIGGPGGDGQYYVNSIGPKFYNAFNGTIKIINIKIRNI
jgi:hypothetical protein